MYVTQSLFPFVLNLLFFMLILMFDPSSFNTPFIFVFDVALFIELFLNNKFFTT